nr:hypothetical protein [Streptomyces sp. alain-838]
MDDTSIDRCPVCWSPVADGARWMLLFQRQTAEGDVEYCRSTCGCTVVLLAGNLVKSMRVDEWPQ